MKVGFIGLGRMGSGMARNLLRAGHDVTVYNRTLKRSQGLSADGAKIAATVAEACRVDALITMLANDDAVAEVVLGADGIVSHLQPAHFTSLRARSAWLSLADSLRRTARTDRILSRRRYLDAPTPLLLLGSTSRRWGSCGARGGNAAAECPRTAHIRRLREARGCQSGQAERQLSLRVGDRVAGRGAGSGLARRAGLGHLHRFSDQHDVRRSRVSDLRPAYRAAALRARRVRRRARAKDIRLLLGRRRSCACRCRLRAC